MAWCWLCCNFSGITREMQESKMHRQQDCRFLYAAVLCLSILLPLLPAAVECRWSLRCHTWLVWECLEVRVRWWFFDEAGLLLLLFFNMYCKAERSVMRTTAFLARGCLQVLLCAAASYIGQHAFAGCLLMSHQ
jgi:hypothetical protein